MVIPYSVLPLLCSVCLPVQAELLTGSSVANVEEAHQAGQELLKRGCGSVIITLGPQGCVVLKAQESTPRHVPTAAVTAVDTTVSIIHMLLHNLKNILEWLWFESTNQKKLWRDGGLVCPLFWPRQAFQQVFFIWYRHEIETRQLLNGLPWNL